MAPNSRPASACSMVSALIAGGEGQQQCPVCGCQYDLGKQRKLVDTNCGHARCFKCMFAVEQCPLCQQVCMRQPSNNNGIDRHHGGFEPGTTNHQSCISRESGFQSFNGSVSSVYSTTGKITKLFRQAKGEPRQTPVSIPPLKKQTNKILSFGPGSIPPLKKTNKQNF